MTFGLHVKHDKPYRSLQISFHSKNVNKGNFFSQRPCNAGGNHRAKLGRQWRKVHLGIDAETLEIRAVEITDNRVGDAPMLPELLKQIPSTEPLLSVRGDGAYDTKACYEAISSRQAAAIIPTRKNAKRWKENSAGAKARNETLAATEYLGRTIWKK
jgi:hypothetical protein